MMSGRVDTVLSVLQDKHNDFRTGGQSMVRPAGQIYDVRTQYGQNCRTNIMMSGRVDTVWSNLQDKQ